MCRFEIVDRDKTICMWTDLCMSFSLSLVFSYTVYSYLLQASPSLHVNVTVFCASYMYN